MNVQRMMAKVEEVMARMRNTRVYDQRIEYQLQEYRILRRIVDTFSIDCVFDIGANQGQYGRMLRRNAGFNGTIISVEPNPETFAILEKGSKSDPRWHSKNIGLADHDGEQCLAIMAGHQFTSLSEPIATNVSNVGALNTVRRRITVPVKTLKTFYSEVSRISKPARPFLKMDTQGYDAVIARSAGELISQFVGIQTELSFVRLYSDSIPFQETFELYARLGFTLCAIIPNNAGHFPHLLEQDAIFLNNEFIASS